MLAFRRREDGAGETVLLLHSLFFDGTMFEAVLPLIGHRPTLAPDHRGQGASAAGRKLPTAGLLADDALGLLDALGIAKTHVVGSSMGAYVALEMLGRAPERIATLTLSCCTCRPEADPTRFAALADRITATGGLGLGEDIARLMFSPAFDGRARDRWRGRFDTLRPGTDDVVRAIFAHRGWTGLLRGWGGPLLAISGAQDLAKSPADLAWIAAEGLGRHVVIGDAGHTPAVETPGAFADALRSFLQQHERVAA